MIQSTTQTTSLAGSPLRGSPVPVVTRNPLCDHYDALLRRVKTLGESSATAQTIGVTSATSGEGVSSVAINLAMAAARIDAGRVLLVDANLTAPSLAQTLGVSLQPGLYETLCHGSESTECVIESGIENMCVMPAGQVDLNTASVFQLSAITELLDQLKREFAFIVLDLPTADRLSTCFELAPSLDGVLLVIRAEKVGCEKVLQVRRQLDEAQANILGVVLNRGR